MKLVIFILLFCSSLAASAQFSVQGQVIDGESNTPLPGANVFIANTTKGVSTDADGQFKINGLLSIEYQLVVSFVGYETQAFDVNPKQRVSYKVVLHPVAKSLREVVVRARKMSRIKRATYLRSFTEHFIGRSDNSIACKFENPDVLVLDKNGDVLTAETDSTLLLLNKGLGYRVKIMLTTYQYNSLKDALHYEGHMAYEPLVPATGYQKRRWARNRLRAYYGSPMHFYRSLYTGKANEEGYYFYFTQPLQSDTVVKARSELFNNMRIKMPSIINYNRILDSVKSTKEAPVLKFTPLLEVVYLHEGEAVVFQRFMKARIRKALQISQLKLRAPAELLPDGRVSPVSAAQIGGYWSWELMAESLPLDYDPNDDIEIMKGNR